ncbi:MULTISPECIES: hypothetical protein [unclassified Microbacterium]|uniref:hypothetical protein n=1 Tax=unclassified Microbacterium TaxID=2609290 RepID=UPI000493564B|nr:MULTISPECIES: hypothetical protein [unclassified Microbacterium]
MARSFTPRTSTALPSRGNVFAKVTVTDENGFTLEYAEFEVPLGIAQEAIALLHLHGPNLSDQHGAHASI